MKVNYLLLLSVLFALAISCSDNSEKIEQVVSTDSLDYKIIQSDSTAISYYKSGSIIKSMRNHFDLIAARLSFSKAAVHQYQEYRLDTIIVWTQPFEGFYSHLEVQFLNKSLDSVIVSEKIENMLCVFNDSKIEYINEWLSYESEYIKLIEKNRLPRRRMFDTATDPRNHDKEFPDYTEVELFETLSDVPYSVDTSWAEIIVTPDSLQNHIAIRTSKRTFKFEILSGKNKFVRYLILEHAPFRERSSDFELQNPELN